MHTTIISPQDLYENLTRSNWVVCDCRFNIHFPKRGRESYLEGHIPHAVYVDLEHDLSAQPDGTNGRHPLPPVETLQELIESLGIDNESQVVVYDDDGGGYAVRLWWILQYLGHRGVAVLDGGLQAWMGAGYELSTEPELRARSHFTVELQSDRLVMVDQLLETQGDLSFLLLDSRAPERYRGEEEPLDPVAGHIPGARNRDWRMNLNRQGSFKTRAELKAEFASLLGRRTAKDAVIYCGSGVTACHNVLAFVHAGYEMPRLYGGSWSEWASDPGRAVETGEAPPTV